MTTNVTVRVPPHVDRVLISFEKFTNDHGWEKDGSMMVLAGNVGEFCIHDTRRVCSIAEIKDDPAYQPGRLVPELKQEPRGITINEHAHGDDHHEYARSHKGLSNG
jgi:hypothetical protein